MPNPRMTPQTPPGSPARGPDAGGDGRAAPRQALGLQQGVEYVPSDPSAGRATPGGMRYGKPEKGQFGAY